MCSDTRVKSTKAHTDIYTDTSPFTKKKKTKNECTDRPRQGGARAGTRLKRHFDMFEALLCWSREDNTSLGLNNSEPAQIQPQVTRMPNVWRGQDRKAVDSTPHSQHSSTAAFLDKAL